MQNGCVHLYIGDGKGKTTAALGLLVRAHGAGLSCLFVQFLKGQYTSELASLEALGIPYLRTGEVQKFIPYMDEAELQDCQEDNARCFHELIRVSTEQKPDCIVLDEVLDAVSTGMLSEDALVQFVESVKPHAEVVITGRNPGERIVALADYVTEMKKQKHPYERGLTARKGIEY